MFWEIQKFSGQEVNKMKSSVSPYSEEHSQSKQRIQDITGKNYKSLPMKYLDYHYKNNKSLPKSRP